MASKFMAGLLAAIVVASLGTGILIGMQVGGNTDTPTTSPATDTETAVDAADETATTTSGEIASPTESPTERRTTIPARQFDEQEIAAHVIEYVNEERLDQNRSEFETDDKTATRVSVMAANHSGAMADAGTVAHEIDGVSTTARYKNDELFERCKFKSPEGSYISQPDEEFELVGTTSAGSHYQNDGEEQFNGDERAVARALVDSWNESSIYRDRLLVKGPTRMGVGIEVTADGTVFATVDLCA